MKISLICNKLYKNKNYFLEIKGSYFYCYIVTGVEPGACPLKNAKYYATLSRYYAAFLTPESVFQRPMDTRIRGFCPSGNEPARPCKESRS